MRETAWAWIMEPIRCDIACQRRRNSEIRFSAENAPAFASLVSEAQEAPAHGPAFAEEKPAMKAAPAEQLCSLVFEIPAGGIDLFDAVYQMERSVLYRALVLHNWNINRTAKYLNLNRQTAQEKMKRLKIYRPDGMSPVSQMKTLTLRSRVTLLNDCVLDAINALEHARTKLHRAICPEAARHLEACSTLGASIDAIRNKFLETQDQLPDKFHGSTK